jgi:hypothetical protein
MNWLCRIGLHKWQEICRWLPFGFVEGFLFPILRCRPGWYAIGRKCHRCGKRRYP